MGKKLFSSVLCLLVSMGMVLAQNITIRGVVTDQNGEPVPGATVMVEGTSHGIATDAQGAYTLQVPSNARIVVTVIGYESATIPVQGRTEISIQLNEDVTQLEDAIVVGYGSAKRISTLVGSVSTVRADIVKNAPSASALDMLQGQVAGLTVLTTGGIAGDNNVSMTIHGIGSLGSSSTPLYVIDGIPSSSRTIMAMNPNDIQTISVLKDASATSIYGSRAANGVVYITTKSGSYQTKATVTVRSQWGVSNFADTRVYDNMMSGPELAEFWIRSGIHTPEFIQATYYDKGYNADTKWFDYVTQQNNPQSQNDITIEGGGQKVAYMIGASQFHQRGVTIGNFYDRYTLRSNVQAHPNNWLKVGVNFNVSYDKRQLNGNWGYAGEPASYIWGGLSYTLNPLFPATLNEDGNQFVAVGHYTHEYYMEKSQSKNERYGMIGGTYVEIEPIRNLKIMSRAGVDGGIYLVTNTNYPSAYWRNNSGSKSKRTTQDYSATITNTIEYSFNIGDGHKFTLLAGQEGIANYNNAYSASSSGQTDDRLMELEHGKQEKYSMSESTTESKFLSFFGHAEYTLMDKYLFDGTLRNDQSSRFGHDEQNALFWSVGALWKLKKENFLRDVSWLDDLNFKASYGTQGNAAIGNYLALGLIGTTTPYAGGVSNVVAQPSNPKLTWEKSGALTLALTGKVFDRLDFDIEWYRRQTTSMLLDVPQPYTSGFSTLTDNIGGLRNVGVDVTLGFDILKNRDYFLRFNTTFNYNNEKITELFNGLDRWDMTSYLMSYVVGKPIMFYCPLYAGVDPADGLPMYYVPNPDDPDTATKKETTKKFDQSSLTQSTDKPRNAPINGGFSFSGAWKGLSLQADFSYVIGKWLVNNDAYFYSNPSNFPTSNASKAVSDFWTPENTGAKYPRWIDENGEVVKINFSDFLLEDASFLRMKNLQVAYSMPKKLLNWANGTLNGVKFTFTGRNLLTLTKYNGYDPEVDSNLTYGISGNMKQYLFGVELTF